jgi:hypothetical protein
MTKAAKLSNFDALETRSHILEIAACEQPDAIYRQRVGRDTYTWKAYRLAGCAGGYVVALFDSFTNGKKSVHCVAPLDQLVALRAGTDWEDGIAFALTAFVNSRAIAVKGGR